MEKKAKLLFDQNSEYKSDGKRGMLVVQVRDNKNPAQWDSSLRPFGVMYRDYGYEDELVINNGINFDALVHGKTAFSRRTGLNSGTNYYQVLGNESWWKGSVTSADNNCICAFAGFSGKDDVAIAEAGIACYESLKRTGKSLATGAAEEEEEEQEDAGDEETGEEPADGE
jgi:hypothetical protein